MGVDEERDGDLENLEESTADESKPFPECPNCGAEIVATAVSEPATGTAVPCGCRVIPPALEFE